MEEGNKVPKLLEFLFGEAAVGLVRGGFSLRALAWCSAFDEWLKERLETYSKATYKQAAMTWKRLLRQQPKMPWDFRQADIEAHITWMQAQGYSASTIANMVGSVASFYAWCEARRVDPECEAGFNPAAGVARPKHTHYKGSELWSLKEVHALLRYLKRDHTPLGKREYAFFLARLMLGAPLRNLQRLQWGQIELKRGEAWVRWRPDAEQVPLPGEVWQAILDYLEASGRLAGLGAEAYVFAPLAEPYKVERGSTAEDWVEGRYLSSQQILTNLKIYGRPIGIADKKLNLMALRRTAIRLYLDSCEADTGRAATLEEIQDYLDSQERGDSTMYRLRYLGKMPE